MSSLSCMKWRNVSCVILKVSALLEVTIMSKVYLRSLLYRISSPIMFGPSIVEIFIFWNFIGLYFVFIYCDLATTIYHEIYVLSHCFLVCYIRVYVKYLKYNSIACFSKFCMKYEKSKESLFSWNILNFVSNICFF